MTCYRLSVNFFQKKTKTKRKSALPVQPEQQKPAKPKIQELSQQQGLQKPAPNISAVPANDSIHIPLEIKEPTKPKVPVSFEFVYHAKAQFCGD